MTSVLSAPDGRVVASTPQHRNTPWTAISDGEYIDTTAPPTGFEQTRYLLDESSLEFDVTTEEMGVVHTPIATIDSPDTIPNDGSTADVQFSLPDGETVDAEIVVSGFTDTVTLDPSHVEQVSSTASAGTAVDVVVRGDGIVDAATEIEVVQA